MTAPSPMPWFSTDKKPPRHYKGLRMKTDTHLHEQLEQLIRELVPPGGAPGTGPHVLDLGCGEGALSQRLSDLGYEVVAVDVEAGQFKAEGPTFVPLDFDNPAAVEQFVGQYAGKPDLILAVEVIEHLRSPWDFLAVCRRLCSGQTHLILTTPNVSSWWSRFWFLRTGQLWGFGPESWTTCGHIHPITSTEMRGMLLESGLECLGVTAAGNLPVIWAYNWKRLLASLLMLPFRPFMRGEKDGWVLCYHARKSRGESRKGRGKTKEEDLNPDPSTNTSGP